MKPTSYEILERNGDVILRAISSEAVQGFWNVEIVKAGSGKPLHGLRKHAEHLAQANSVPLIDNTGGLRFPRQWVDRTAENSETKFAII